MWLLKNKEPSDKKWLCSKVTIDEQIWSDKSLIEKFIKAKQMCKNCHGIYNNSD